MGEGIGVKNKSEKSESRRLLLKSAWKNDTEISVY
jgi:hypothetical protein